MKTTSFAVPILAALFAAGARAQEEDVATPAEDASVENTSGVPVPELPEFDKTDPSVYGRQLADYADLYDTGWKDSYAKSRMTLIDASGDSVERDSVQLILEKDEGDKSIVRFMSPAEIKGVAALTHEHPDATDDNWLYLPSTKRVRRISGANKTASFQGTEFTYEDLSNRVVAKYDWKYLGDAEVESDGETRSVYRVEARPRYEDTGYARLVVEFDHATWRPERIEFFDKADQLLKVLVNDQWKLRHGRFWRPVRVTMSNVQTGKKTVIVSELQLLNFSLYKSKRTGKARPNMTDDQFTTRALTGGR